MSSAITIATEANAPAAPRDGRFASEARGSVGETGAATVPMAAGRSRGDFVREALACHFIGELATLAFTERAAVKAEAARGFQRRSLGQDPWSRALRTRALPPGRQSSGDGRHELRGPLKDRPDHSTAKRLPVSGDTRSACPLP